MEARKTDHGNQIETEQTGVQRGPEQHDRGNEYFGFGALPGDRLATPCGLAGDALGGSGHLLTAI